MRSLPRLSTIDVAGLTAITIATLGWYALAYRPGEADRAAFAQLRTSFADAAQQMKDLDRDNAAAKADLSRLSEELARSVKFQDASGVNARLGEIPLLAEERAVVLHEISPGQPVPGSRFARVPIRLAGSAPYEAVQGFFSDLNSRFPDMEVTRFSLSGQPDSPGSPTRFSVELAWWTLPLTPGVAPPNARNGAQDQRPAQSP